MSDINSPATPTAQDSPASARLEAGLTAPNFTLPSDNGDSITLSALRGQNIVLYFYPAAMTPGCTTEAYQRIRWTSSSGSASAII